MKKLFFIALVLTFSIISFAQNKNSITLRGNIANRKSDFIRIGKRIYDSSKESYVISDGSFKLKEIHINSDGSFEDTFKLKEGLYCLSNGDRLIRIYFKKGYDLTVNIDNNKFESAVFTGEGSEENNYLVKYCLINSEIQEDNPYLFDLSEAEFKKVVNDKKAADLKRLHENKLNKNLVALQEKNIDEQIKLIEGDYLKTSRLRRELKNTVPASFDFINSNGESTKLEGFKGKYVYLTLWNNKAISKFRQLSFLKNLEDQYRDKNIAFVFISIDDVSGMLNWKRMVKATELRSVHLFADDIALMSPFMSSFKLEFFPRFVILNPDGRIVDADAITPSNPAINSVLDSLLK